MEKDGVLGSDMPPWSWITMQWSKMHTAMAYNWCEPEEVPHWLWQWPHMENNMARSIIYPVFVAPSMVPEIHVCSEYFVYIDEVHVHDEQLSRLVSSQDHTHCSSLLKGIWLPNVHFLELTFHFCRNSCRLQNGQILFNVNHIKLEQLYGGFLDSDFKRGAQPVAFYHEDCWRRQVGKRADTI